MSRSASRLMTSPDSTSKNSAGAHGGEQAAVLIDETAEFEHPRRGVDSYDRLVREVVVVRVVD